MSNARSRRMGFSLLELLVVVSIVAILSVLTLSAVEGARDTARGASCADHVRQLGLGLAMHHDTHGAFPSNGGWDGRQTIVAKTGGRVEVYTKTNQDKTIYHWGMGDPALAPEKQTGGWPYAILPYIEQRNLYNQVNIEVGLALYHCPSRRDPTPIEPPASDEIASYSGGGWAWGKIDYATNAHIIRNRPGTRHPNDPEPKPNQPAANASLSRLAGIRDGTANTILLGEKSMDPERYDTGGWFWDEPFLLGGSYASSRGGIDVLPDRVGIFYKNNWGSAHASGVHFGMADGSARLIRFGATPPVMRALLTPSGQDVTDVP